MEALSKDEKLKIVRYGSYQETISLLTVENLCDLKVREVLRNLLEKNRLDVLQHWNNSPLAKRIQFANEAELIRNLCASNCPLEMTKFFVEEVPKNQPPVDFTEKHGAPIYCALCNGKLDLVKYLVEVAPTIEGQSPLPVDFMAESTPRYRSDWERTPALNQPLECLRYLYLELPKLGFQAPPLPRLDMVAKAISSGRIELIDFFVQDFTMATGQSIDYRELEKLSIRYSRNSKKSQAQGKFEEYHGLMDKYDQCKEHNIPLEFVQEACQALARLQETAGRQKRRI